jgi:pyridoxal phosphate enzyme (YggS family)
VIGERLADLRERIARAAARAGRRPEDVTIVAVSKTFPADAVREAFAAGVRDFGENKVQEAEGKLASLQDLRTAGARFHLVGHLQGNKARKAVALFDRVHSVDSVELALRLEHIGAEQRKTVRILVQVDLAGESTKHGMDEKHVLPALEQIRGFKSVHAEGLMVLPPFLEDPEAARPFFRRLAELRDVAVARNLLRGRELSMGMSHDLEPAVEEGATLVRVGTAIFGERKRR